MTQKQIDNLITQSVTKSVDAYNTMTSPYSVTLFKKVKGNNWLINQKELDGEKNYTYTKLLLPDYDTLKLRIDPISQLKYKYITDFTISFKTNITNNESIPKISNLTAIVFDNEYPLEVNEYVKSENNIECGLFNMDLTDEIIYDAIQASEFWIQISFKGNGSNCKLEIYDFKVDISFTNDLEVEKEAIYNRLEDLFDDIDLNLDDLNRTVYPENYPQINLITADYEIFKTEYIQCTLTKNGIGIENANIECFINDIYIGNVETGINGVFNVPVPDMMYDFNLKCIFKGNSLNSSTSLNTDISVVKYSPNFNIHMEEEDGVEKTEYIFTPTQKEPISLNCIFEENRDIIDGHPVNIICNLKNKSNNNILNTLKFTNVNGDLSINFNTYNATGTSNINARLEVILQTDNYYNEVIKTKDITLKYQSDITYVNKTPTISLASGYNSYGDNLYFRVKDGSTVLTKGTCTITLNGKTLANIKAVNGRFSIPLNSTYGISNSSTDEIYYYKVVFSGYSVTNGNVITVYKSVTLNSRINVYGERTKTVQFTKYAGYEKNTNDGAFRKWYTLGSGEYYQCICGNKDYPITPSSGSHHTPRQLKCSGINTDLSGVTIKKITVHYADTNFPITDSLSTSNSCSIGKSTKQCQLTINGTTSTFTDKVNPGNKSWAKHSFSKTGSWTPSQVNSMYFILYYGKNQNGNTGRLKVQNCYVIFTYKYNQIVN